MDKIMYKGAFGTIVEDVEYPHPFVPSIIRQQIYTGDHIPKVGDVVTTSSCDIPYHDVWRNCWDVKPYPDSLVSQVVLELQDYDDSEFEIGKGRNGGKYLTMRYKVVAVENTQTFEKYNDC